MAKKSKQAAETKKRGKGPKLKIPKAPCEPEPPKRPPAPSPTKPWDRTGSDPLKWLKLGKKG